MVAGEPPRPIPPPPGFDACVFLRGERERKREGEEKAGAENKTEISLCKEHLFVPPLGPEHDEPSEDPSLIMNVACFADC